MKPAPRIEAKSVAERPARVSLTSQDFLARIAHELRGPAGVTLGALDELEREGESIGNQQRHLLGMARRGALKVLRTAERLSRISQLESGTLVLNPVSTDLSALSQRACADARALEPRKGVNVEVDVSASPVLVALDEGWAHAALVELITSALRTARECVRVQMTAQGAVQISTDSLTWANAAAKRPDNHGHRDSALSISLATEIAELHGGSVHVTTEGSEARAVVFFEEQS